jgi:hypothetical protein
MNKQAKTSDVSPSEAKEYIKISSKKVGTQTTFRYLKEFDKGNNTVCIVQREGKRTEYILKNPDNFEKDVAYDDIRVLRLYANANDLELSETELLENAENFFDSGNMYETYLINREIFSNEIVELINSGSSAKGRFFYEKNSTGKFFGSKFIPAYRDWEDIYDNEENTIYGHPVIDGIFVSAGDNKKLPIRGLGACAVIGVVLGVKDMHPGNWGLIAEENSYRVVLIDVGDSLLKYAHTDAKNNIQTNSQTNLINLLKEFYEPLDENDELPLPKEAYVSEIIRKEIYETIIFLKELSFNKIEILADKYFKEFPFHKLCILEEIKNGIENLYERYTKEIASKCETQFFSI